MDSIRHRLGRDSSDIKDQIPNLAVEDIRGAILQSICSIRITIDQSEALESGSGLEYGKAVWIPNYLGVVIIND